MKYFVLILHMNDCPGRGYYDKTGIIYYNRSFCQREWTHNKWRPSQIPC